LYPQVFSQPVFHGIEQALTDHVPGVRRLPAWSLRIIVRTLYVCFTTTVAAVMPFFTDIIGLVRYCGLGWWLVRVCVCAVSPLVKVKWLLQ
jgi:hypothetical protein